MSFELDELLAQITGQPANSLETLEEPRPAQHKTLAGSQPASTRKGFEASSENTVLDEINPPSGFAGNQPASYPQEPAPPDPAHASLRVLRVDAGKQPANRNAVLDKENTNLAGLRVEDRVHPHRDPDPSGCPTHWQRVPLLPEKGSRVALLTPDGYGALYRFRHREAWYVLKFLPPFDGRLSLRSEGGQTWVFPNLNDLARYLGALEEVTDELADDDDVVII